ASQLLTGHFSLAGDGEEAAPESEGPPQPAAVRVRPAAASGSAGTASAADRGGTPAVPAGHPDLLTRADLEYYRSVARVGLQVAEALAYAHAQKILHRDIKPSNLLLDGRGTVWVTDFGLAKEEGSDLTRTGQLVGTLRYMAPERFAGVSDPRSDIYALGLTLYELLTLRPAFDETDQGRLLRQVTQTEPPRPRKLDPRLTRATRPAASPATGKRLS